MYIYVLQYNSLDYRNRNETYFHHDSSQFPGKRTGMHGWTLKSTFGFRQQPVTCSYFDKVSDRLPMCWHNTIHVTSRKTIQYSNEIMVLYFFLSRATDRTYTVSEERQSTYILKEEKRSQWQGEIYNTKTDLR